jgi:hypothetical protein
MLTVRSLLKLIKELPDEAIVLVPGSTWTEDYGEATTPESEYGERQTVLIIGG